MWTTWLRVWLAALGACVCVLHAAPVTEKAGYAERAMAPLVASAAEAVPHSYMIVLKEGVSSASFLAHRAQLETMLLPVVASGADERDLGFRHVFEMGTHLQGYAGRFPPALIEWIRAQPEVDYVEEDAVVSITALEHDGRAVREMPREAAVLEAPGTTAWGPFQHLTELGAPWGLARVSHRAGLTLGTFNRYVYEAAGGEGVTAYVIDTGIRVDHEDFGGRARWGTTIPRDDVDLDQHGHGTHCAGTIGSLTYGVAKEAELVAVKVLNSQGRGAMSDVTAGVLWAVNDAQKELERLQKDPTSARARKHRGFVANMSLGGGKSVTLDRAVAGAVAAGVHFAVAAGNENQDACNVSPAGTPHAVTVAASTIADERAYFSNHGRCVDMFAPGLNVVSTWPTSRRGINTMSGTSMATPHVAGLMAYLLSIYGSPDFMPIEGVPVPRRRRWDLSALLPAAPGAGSVWSLARLVSSVRTLVRAPAPASALSTPAPASTLSTLTPGQLKKALVAFSTHDILGGLPEATVNRLAYNNATTIRL